MKQREAVYKYVTEVLGSEFEPGMNVYDSMNTERRAKVNEAICNDITAGEVDFSDSAKEKYDTPAKLKGYVSGLISNWIRKDKQLNGDQTYVPANPGSRTGQGDPQLRELRKLLKLHKGTNDEAKIQSFIDARVNTIKAERDMHISIDSDLLPEELQGLAS